MRDVAVVSYGRFHSRLVAQAYYRIDRLNAYFHNYRWGIPDNIASLRAGPLVSSYIKLFANLPGCRSISRSLYENRLFSAFNESAIRFLDASDSLRKIHVFSMYADEICSRFDRTSLDFASIHFDVQDQIKRRFQSEFNISVSLIRPEVRARAESEFSQCWEIIVPSEFAKSTFPREMKNKINVVPIGGVIERHASLKTRYIPRLHGSRFKIGFFGGAAIEKGLVLLLHSIAYSRFECDVHIFGAGKKRDFAIYSRFFKKCLNTNFYFHGPVHGYHEVNKTFKLMDCIVVPSSMEGFGLLAVESVLSGVPTVVSKYVGAVDLLKEMPNCLVYDPWCALSFAEVIEKVKMLRESGIPDKKSSTIDIPVSLKSKLGLKVYGEGLMGSIDE